MVEAVRGQEFCYAEKVVTTHAEGVGRGFVNTNQKVALKLLPVSGPERMPHCSFLKNEEFLKNSLPCFMTIIKYKKQVTCIVLIYPYSS